MNKILAYYSLIIVVLCVLFCLFDSQGDEATFIGGILFLPIIFHILETIKEAKKIEEEDELDERMWKEEKMRATIKEEIKEELKNSPK